MRAKRTVLVCGLVAALATLAACAAPAQDPVIPAPTAAAPEVTPAPASQPAPVAPAPVPVIPSTVAATGPVTATPLIVSHDGDAVSIPLSAIAEVVNAEFGISVDERSLDFMAYIVDGRLYVRASACPPCTSLAYTLDGDELLCEACDSRFDVVTGEGVAGACVDYPKASVPYEVDGDRVVMKVVDLVRAWDETELEGTAPLPEEVFLAVEEPAEPASRPSCCGG